MFRGKNFYSFSFQKLLHSCFTILYDLGETFFECAERKVADETGNPRKFIKAKAVVHVWNSFFPTSNWDKKRMPGYEGSQTVNIVVLCDLDAEVCHASFHK